MTNYTYMLNTQAVNQLAAHQACTADGSFLVTYMDAREQVGAHNKTVVPASASSRLAGLNAAASWC
jgi:hypothetical protein